MLQSIESLGGDYLNDPPAVTPYTVIHRSGKASVRHYLTPRRTHSTPVALVYALIKRPFILDLQPGVSVVEDLTRRGFEVFLIDWIPPERDEAWRGFEAYVNDLAVAIRAIRQHERLDGVSVIGYCLGALLSVICAALHPVAIQNLITLTVPIDIDLESGAWSWLDERAISWITDTYGNCPAWLLRNTFATISSTYEAAHAFGFFPQTERELYSRLYPAFRQWLASDVPLAGKLFRELLIDVFKNNLLARGQMIVGSNAVDLGSIKVPLLNVVAETDLIVPCRSSLPLIDLVGSIDQKNLMFPSGHVGVAVSRDAHAKLWPQIANWLAEHDDIAQNRNRFSCERF